MQKLKNSISSILAAVLLTACAHHPSQQAQTKSFAPSHPVKNHTPLVSQLRQQGIQVIHLGDQWRLVLPSDNFFSQGSTELNKQHDKAFIQIADLISSVGNNVQVYVTGYTDNTGSQRQQKNKAAQYANTAAAYLWAQGIQYRNLHIRGAGNKNRVANNSTPQGQTDNRRVEITFHS